LADARTTAQRELVILSTLAEYGLATRAVDAYSLDVERVGDRVYLKDAVTDGRWMSHALRLERLAWDPRPRPPSTDVLHITVPGSPRNAAILQGAGRLEPGVARLLAWAESMEKNSGLLLAYSVLTSARAIWLDCAPRGIALSLVQSARIARTLGDHRVAGELYSTAEHAARACSFETCTARALVGQGAINQEAGSIASAREFYLEAVSTAPASSSVRSLAYLGLSSLGLLSGDLDAAVEYSVRSAMDEPRAIGRRAEALMNLSEVALRVGEPLLALDAARWILRRRIQGQVRLTSIGVASVAAGRLGRDSLVNRYAAQARRESASTSLPYPAALMWRLLAEGHEAIGDMRASEIAAQRASRLAEEFGFERIHANVERLLARESAAPLLSRQALSRATCELVAV
jgi:hypothetical protein